jgi:hypothetical protein
VQTQADVARSGLATTPLPASFQLAGQLLLFFVTLAQDPNFLGAALFGVSEGLKTVGSQRNGGSICHGILAQCSQFEIRLVSSGA